MTKINVSEIVSDLMVIGMQPEARDGLRDHTAQRESKIIRTSKEFFCGMRIGDQSSAVRSQLRTEIRSLPPGEPQGMRCDEPVGPADHFKFEVCHNFVQRHDRLLHEISRP
jgi:hypothetical protein